MDLIKNMTNQQLFNSLKDLNAQIGPVTSETRSIYEKRLFRFLECKKCVIEVKINSDERAQTDSNLQTQIFFEDEIIKQLKEMSLNTN